MYTGIDLAIDRSIDEQFSLKNSIPKIAPPKFKVGRYTVNEYELRQILYMAADGLWKHPNVIVKDAKGNEAYILSDGRLSRNLVGLELSADIAMKTYRIQRKKALNKQ